MRERLSSDLGLDVRAPEDPFEAQGNRDALVELSGALKVIAVSLTKIANDLAMMGSGPRAGIGELFLPELQKGSSIMPGKVNPVIPEVVLQVSAQVIGNDTAITVGGLQGQFELNVRIPLIARNLLQSIALLDVHERAVRGEVRRRDRGEPRRLRGVRRGHARRRHRAQPVHRLRQGRRHRQGRVGERPHAARGRARARRRRGDARRRPGPAQDRGRLLGGMSAVGTDADLLGRIEAYYDAAPRPAADVEEHGALTLFVSRIPWRFYGRPRLGLGEDVGADDVAAVRARQRELGVREAFEWVHETTPSLAGAAAAAGLDVLRVPLLALDPAAWAPPAAPADVELRMLGADDPALPAAQAVVELAFAAEDMSLGDAGTAARDLAAERLDDLASSASGCAATRPRWRSPRARSTAPLAAGSHQPVGHVSEVMGVGTLPSARRRGIGAALTGRLVEHARERGSSSCSSRRPTTTSRACTTGSASGVSAPPASATRAPA